MKQYQIIISICLLVLNIILIIASLATPNWSQVNGSKQMSLVNCVDCNSLYNDWNFECLARTYCEQDSDLGTCKVNTNLYKASYAYLVLELLSLIMALLLLEKLFIWLLKKQIGQPVLVYIQAGLMLFFHLLATILWASLSQAKWSGCSSTSDLYQTPSVCAKSGPSIALANIFLMTGTLSHFFIIFWKRSVLHIHSTLSFKKLFWIKGKLWVLILMMLLGLSYILILASLSANKWVSYVNDVQGSLVRCVNCDAVDNLGWQCLASKECWTNSVSDNCKLYTRLGQAGRTYLVLEGISIIFLLFFAQSLTALLKELNYGIGLLNYAYPLLAMLFNLLACAVWFGISSAQFSNSTLSALDGPSLSVASQFFLIPLSTLFCLVYRFRSVNFFDNRTLNKTIIDKVQDVSIVNNTMSESPKKAHMPDLDNVVSMGSNTVGEAKKTYLGEVDNVDNS